MYKINVQRHAGFYPFNPSLGQLMQTGVEGISCDQAFIAHLSFTTTQAVVAAAAGVLASVATSTDDTVVTKNLIDLPCAKNITATAGGVADDVKAVQIILEGVDIGGNVITETLPVFTVNTIGTVTGSKAFAKVTKATIPGMDGAGVTITLGYGEKLGLPFKLSHNTVLAAYHNNVLESTDPTVTVSSLALSGNTIFLSTALNGSVVDVYLVA